MPQDGSVAFLLSQLGALAGREFARRLRPLGITPAEAGVLRALGGGEPRSQRALADALDVHATRLVAVVGGLEERGLVSRERRPADRRAYVLELTPAGREALASVAAAGREQERAFTRGLSAGERAALVRALRGVAAAQGLTPGVHPGLRGAPRALDGDG
ncbi:MAG: MarR family transcriptional regulator [Thermoleophilia bacterium]|nr:MarR family transcriptional regulator [Thermoleophilia bacterium]